MIDIYSHIVFDVNYEPSTKGKRTRVICSEFSVDYIEQKYLAIFNLGVFPVF